MKLIQTPAITESNLHINLSLSSARMNMDTENKAFFKSVNVFSNMRLKQSSTEIKSQIDELYNFRNIEYIHLKPLQF